MSIAIIDQFRKRRKPAAIVEPSQSPARLTEPEMFRALRNVPLPVAFAWVLLGYDYPPEEIAALVGLPLCTLPPLMQSVDAQIREVLDEVLSTPCGGEAAR